MDCETAREQWHARTDGAPGSASLDRHLAACDACRGYAREMARVVEALDQLGIDTESITARATGAEPVVPRKQDRRRLARFVRAGLSAAALIGLAASLWWLQNPPDAPSPVLDTTASWKDAGTPGRKPGKLAAPPILGITLRPNTARRMIAVSQPTSREDVQMFRLYPRLGQKTSEPASAPPIGNAGWRLRGARAELNRDARDSDPRTSPDSAKSL